MMLSQVLGSMKQDSDGWSAEIPEDWLIGRTTFGGLQAALAIQAARGLVADGLPLRSAQIAFVGPVPGGPVRIATRLLRRGSSVTHTEARICRGEETLCLVVAIFGAPRTSVLRFDPAMPPPAVPTESARLLPILPGVSPAFGRHYEFHWTAGAMPYGGGKDPLTQILVRYRDPQALSEAHMVAIGDSIPSPGISVMTKFARSASLTWTLEVLDHEFDFDSRLFWRLDAEITAGRDGYLAQTATMWNPAGRIAALCRQTAVVFG